MLRYNSQTIKLIPSECDYNSVGFSTSELSTITTILFHIFMIPPKKLSTHKQPILPTPLSPGPGNHRSNFPSLDISQKWNHTVCDFYDWFLSFSMLFSRFIYVSASVSTSLLFVLKNIQLYGYTPFLS